MNQFVIKMILERTGCTYHFAKDGEEACNMVLKRKYDVILMDCQMPKMNGLIASLKIRQIEKELGRARCPIVALTANAMVGDREKCLESGMDDFLAKPFRSKDLTSLMEFWLRIPVGEL